MEFHVGLGDECSCPPLGGYRLREECCTSRALWLLDCFTGLPDPSQALAMLLHLYCRVTRSLHLYLRGRRMHRLGPRMPQLLPARTKAPSLGPVNSVEPPAPILYWDENKDGTASTRMLGVMSEDWQGCVTCRLFAYPTGTCIGGATATGRRGARWTKR